MSASVARRRRRIEALIHALLRDADFFLCVESAARDEYRHRTEPLTAYLDRVALPTMLVAVTLVDEMTGRPLGMASGPNRLRVLLWRCGAPSTPSVTMLTVS